MSLPMVRGINIVDARTSPCAIEYDANAVGLNLVEAKDALVPVGRCLLFLINFLFNFIRLFK